MQAPTQITVSTELHGWRKVWARVRRRPWRWEYQADVKFGDPVVADGVITYPLTVVGKVEKTS